MKKLSHGRSALSSGWPLRSAMPNTGAVGSLAALSEPKAVRWTAGKASTTHADGSSTHRQTIHDTSMQQRNVVGLKGVFVAFMEFMEFMTEG